MNEVINLISLLGMDYNILFLEDLLDEMGEKIMKNKSILDDKKKLKKIQTYSIMYVKNMLVKDGEFNLDIFNYYQIINFFRDLDFCLKFLVLKMYFLLNNKNHKFIN